MTIPTLLPPASTPLERALSQSMGRFSHGQIIPGLWDANRCPVALLPYLAWALSVDEWDPLWSENTKRAAIAAARDIHQRKGTPSAIRRALATIGQPDAEIIERADFIRCDGSVVCDGTRSCGGRWATYRIKLFKPITIGMARLTKRLLASVGRNAVHLLSIEYQESSFRCDGTIICDGEYSCGSVNTMLT